MLNLLTKIFPFNSIQIIGVFLKEETIDYNLVVLHKKGAKVSIKAIEKYTSFEALIQKLNQKLPIILVMDGKGVLYKKMDYNNENDLNWFKNLNYESIHHSMLKTSNYSFISFCRKQLADEILMKFYSLKLPIIDFFVGSLHVFIISKINDIIEVAVNETAFKFSNSELEEVYKRKENSIIHFNIGEETIDSEVLQLYSAGLYFFMNENELTKSESSLIKKEELIYKKGFDKIGTIGLIFFFSTLLLSYFLINFLNSKNAELNLENIYSNQSYQMVVDLEKSKEDKLKILNETGSFKTKYHSFYIQEIINTLPNDIILSELNVSPLEKEIKSNEKVKFRYNEILVSGSFIKEYEFNYWITIVKKNQWIKSLEIIQIKKDKKNRLQFELKINV
jgi:hypothetical protein